GDAGPRRRVGRHRQGDAEGAGRFPDRGEGFDAVRDQEHVTQSRKAAKEIYLCGFAALRDMSFLHFPEITSGPCPAVFSYGPSPAFLYCVKPCRARLAGLSLSALYLVTALGAARSLRTGLPLSGCAVRGGSLMPCSTSKTSPSLPSGSIT